jgi:alpha-L-fucosidase
MAGTKAREEHGFQTQFTSQDFWFTLKESDIYVIALEYPEKEVIVKSLGNSGKKVKSVQMLGSQTELVWKQTGEGLEVILPEEQPNANGYVLKIGL